MFSDIRYDEQMEEFLDEAYDRFVAKKEGSTKQRKRAKKEAQSDDAKLLEVWSSCIAYIAEDSLCCIALCFSF